jgi:two-component system cell cycle response regulator
MMDLDNFKQVNDTYGHDIGDLVLKRMAAMIIDTIQGNAVACRYGGEEFCILYPGTDLAGALKISERIKQVCCGSPISSHRITQTISGGLACFPETSSPETLVADADICLYKAKRTGKNKIVADFKGP